MKIDDSFNFDDQLFFYKKYIWNFFLNYYLDDCGNIWIKDGDLIHKIDIVIPNKSAIYIYDCTDRSKNTGEIIIEFCAEGKAIDLISIDYERIRRKIYDKFGNEICKRLIDILFSDEFSNYFLFMLLSNKEIREYFIDNLTEYGKMFINNTKFFN